MELMVEAEALVKRFGPVRALAGIDLAVQGVRLPWCWESIVSLHGTTDSLGETKRPAG